VTKRTPLVEASQGHGLSLTQRDPYRICLRVTNNWSGGLRYRRFPKITIQARN